MEEKPKANEFVIIFTHIAPQSIESLEKYLRNSIFRGYDKKFVHYFNTLEMQLDNLKEMQNYQAELPRKDDQLAGYGFKR